MRYLKPFFENNIDIDNLLLKEIGEISYILEDEGYVVEFGIYNPTDNDKLFDHKKTLWIRISFKSMSVSDNQYEFDVKLYRKREEILRELDEFEEYKDRIADIFNSLKIKSSDDMLDYQKTRRQGLPYILMNFEI